MGRGWMAFLLALQGLALAQTLDIVPLSGETRMAALEEVRRGSGLWSFAAHLAYDTLGTSGAYRILVELVPAGPPGVSLAAYLTPGTPQVLMGSGPGTLRASGRTLWPRGFQPLLEGVGAVRARLPLTLELEARASGPLLPGYYFLHVAATLLPQ